MPNEIRMDRVIRVLVGVIFLHLASGFLNFETGEFGSLSSESCNSPMFPCHDGTCLRNSSYRCDGKPHCPTAEDEVDCDWFLCSPPKFFRCNNGQCIKSTGRCNKLSDCEDGSDENKCSDYDPTVQQENCKPTEFRCTDGVCISRALFCDNHTNCDDGSDETPGCGAKKICEHDQFRCGNGTCLSGNNRCDGKKDCDNGDDELHCEHQPVDLINCTAANRKFACKDTYKCIDIRATCNGVDDCYDKSDELEMCNAPKNKCENCRHECKITPDGPVCICGAGFILNPSNNSCQDINECEIIGICDQKCINTPGSYHCSCDRIYNLTTDGHTCVLKEGEEVLMYTTEDKIKGISLKIPGANSFVIADEVPKAVAIAADADNVYWAAYRNGFQAIVKSRQNDDTRHTIVKNGVVQPEGLALDWITKNIYFSDRHLRHIAVCSDDGRSCAVLHSRSVDLPRAIALAPEHGLMFWTDWGSSPSIGRSGMDGSDSIPFVSTNIKWPNGVAVDAPGERIYWVDAKIDIIETINFDQTGRRVVVFEPEKHAFSIAVFENRLYWSDLVDMVIHSCNKFTGKDRGVVTHEFSHIHGIHLKHPLLVTTEFTDPCQKRECSDLCVLGPPTKKVSKGPSRVCLCPDGKELSSDGATCKQIKALPTIVIGARDQLHVVKHNKLGHDEIESISFRDMVISALTYNSNEGTVFIANSLNRNIYSFDLNKRKSPKPVVTYGLGLVRSMEYDEFGNNLYWCDSDSFSIEAISLKTMARTLIFDGNKDNKPMDLILAPEHGFIFVTIVSSDDHVRIDRLDMAGNTSSSIHLVEKNLGTPEIKLLYTREQQKLFWADHVNGDIESVSLDGSNRRQVISAVSPYTLTFADGILFWFSIESSNISWYDFDYFYVSTNTRLDLDEDISRSNAMVMTAISKPANYSSPCQINNGGCSHLCLVSCGSDSKKVCACPVGYSLSTDNLSCQIPRRCLYPEFQCYTGECIPAIQVCDHKNDCIHGEDEQIENCNIEMCPVHQFLCSDKKCVDRKLQCDGQPDCADGSDEICDFNCTIDSSKFRCDSGECIDIQFRCDGKIDCKHAQDESHCDNTTCTANDFTCKSGQCIPKEWECDTETDCVDGSDEHRECRSTHCDADEFRCTNEKCIDHKLVCNGHNDCGDDSDEQKCRTATSNDHSNYVYKICNSRTEFFCPFNGRPCAPISVRCNGTKECSNGEDEQHCFTNPCRSDEFYCRAEKQCIPREWVCNHKDDCSDGSDEHKETCFTTPKKEQQCSGFQCADGKCIPLSQVCNMVYDCADSSDEGKKCDVSCQTHGCSQKCFKLPSGPKCECVRGYYLGTDNKTCVDENECEMDVCAQNCTNLPGKFKCGCFSAEHRLRSDHVSCKATGPPLVYVTASENQLTVVSNDLKHTAGVKFGTHLFNDIVAIDVDVQRNYIFVLFKNNILQRTISGLEHQKVQKILPHTVDFTVDWITDNVYYTDGETIRFTNLNHSMDDLDTKLYKTTHDIWAVVVDPIAGYVFWFETNPLKEDGSGKVMRMEGDGRNVMSISKLEYGVNKLVVDSFARHLYWFDSRTQSIRRMNYDGTSKTLAVHTKGQVVTFAFFENSVYWSSPGLILVKKCRVYGRHPRNCEFVKLSSHTVEHLAILQKNSQRLGPHPAGNFSSKMMCAGSPTGPKCICVNELQGNQLCSTFVSPTRFRRKMNLIPLRASGQGDDGPGFGMFIASFVIFILVASTGVIAYWHHCKPESKILHRLHFHNAAYDVPESAFVGGIAKEPLLKPGEHAYENPFCQNLDDSNSSSYSFPKNENSTCLKQLEEEPDSEYVVSSRKSFKEPLLKD